MVGGLGAAGGSIGAYAAAFAVGLGAGEVVYAAHDRTSAASWRRSASARSARRARPPGSRHGRVTVDASGFPDGLAFALRSTGAEGVATCTAGAVHHGHPVPLPVYEMHMNVATFRTGWVHARALLDVPLELIADGLFDPTAIATTHGFDDAPVALAEPFAKLIFDQGG